MLSVFGLITLCMFTPAFAQKNPYDAIIGTTINSTSLKTAIASEADIVKDEKWADLFNEQVKLLIKYAIDVFIIIWIAIAFLWWYKVMTSNAEDKMKEWIRYIIFGVLWVIIMVSARFLAEGLVWDTGIIADQFKDADNPSWVELAQDLYEKLMYPFIKVALYLVTWVLFIMMAVKVITFVISTDEAAKKKAGWVILWCVIWILIVMWSKQIVESVMWKQEKVLSENAEWITATPWDTGWMGNYITHFESIPLIAQVINWVMWLTMFLILVLIIIQGYKMFAKPDDPKNRESLKKTLLYIIIWVLVIWASYVISNVLVLNGFNNIN